MNEKVHTHTYHESCLTKTECALQKGTTDRPNILVKYIFVYY